MDNIVPQIYISSNVRCCTTYRYVKEKTYKNGSFCKEGNMFALRGFYLIYLLFVFFFHMQTFYKP